MNAAASSPSSGFFTQGMSLIGTVTSVDVPNASFTLQCRSGDTFHVQTTAETNFAVVRNMDDLDRDRLPNPPDYDPSKGASEKVRKYITQGYFVGIAGIQIQQG